MHFIMSSAISFNLDQSKFFSSGNVLRYICNQIEQFQLMPFDFRYTVSLLYIGLSLNVGNLSGNIYANFAISCVMETIGYALCFPGLYKLGRKKFHCICMITGGLVLLVSIIPQVHGTEG